MELIDHLLKHFVFVVLYKNSNKKKKKSLAQEVRQKSYIFRNVEVKVEGRFVPFNPYFVCNTAIGTLCDLYGVTLPKN